MQYNGANLVMQTIKAQFSCFSSNFKNLLSSLNNLKLLLKCLFLKGGVFWGSVKKKIYQG